MVITLNALRSAYARSFKTGGRVRYGAGGFRILHGVTADGRNDRGVSPQLPEIEYEEPVYEEPVYPNSPGINLFGQHVTPEDLYIAATEGNPNVNFLFPENRAQLDEAKKVFLMSPEGKAWKEKMAKENAAGHEYGVDMATRQKYRTGIELDDADKAYWDAAKDEAAKWLDSDEGKKNIKNAFAVDIDDYVKPVEEEDIGNEGVTDYNDFYNNASRKAIRGVAHGKGWTNANGEELLWTGDNRKQNRKYARSVRQGRRQDIRNIRNGRPSSGEYRYAPMFERNGGTMEAVFMNALRRGGKLLGKYQGGGI